MHVFCELCSEQRTSAETEFHITSCCHIFCGLCSTTANKCPICDKPCRTTLMNKELAPTIKEYLVNQAEQLTKIGKIYQFQINKMDKFIEANQNVFEEYETSKNRIQKLKQMYEAYKKGIKDEQALINHLQQKRKEALAGTVGSTADQSLNPTDTQTTIQREEFFQNVKEASNGPK